MSFFAKVWAWIKPIGPKMANFLAPFGKLIVASGGSLLAEIAINAVATAQKTGLSNEEKRKQAFTQIKKDAEASGLKAADKLINATLELALIKITEK